MVPNRNSIIRRAIPADRDALHSLIERAYRGAAARRGWTHEADLLGGQRTDRAALTAMLDDPLSRLLLAFDDGALVGCVHVAARGDGLCYLGLLSVDPDCQGRGIGSRLIAAAEDCARTELHATTMEMTVIARRTELIAYYARRNYLPTGEVRPFPRTDSRFGLPLADDLDFAVLARSLV